MITHKLVQPIPKTKNQNPVRLYQIILCWESNMRVACHLGDVSLSTNINDVDCIRCQELWCAGIYN